MNYEDEPVSNGIIFTSTRAVPARVVEEEEEPQGSAAIDERTERARERCSARRPRLSVARLTLHALTCLRLRLTVPTWRALRQIWASAAS